MNISWQWLGELVDLHGITSKTLSDKLTLAGFEIENTITTANKDNIIDISYTSNRSDTNSIVGMAQEVSSICNRKLTTHQGQSNIPLWKKYIAVNTCNEEKYIVSKIENISIQESPNWLKQKLATYGIKSTTNLNDIINFIAIKWSQHIQILYINKPNEIIHINKLKTIEANRTICELSLKQDTCITTGKSSIVLQLSVPQKSIRKKLQNSNKYNQTIKNLYKSDQYLNQQNQLDAYSEAILLITALGKTNYPDQIVCLQTKTKVRKPIKFSYYKNDQILGPIECTNDNLNKRIIKRHKIHNIFNSLYFINHDSRKICYIDIPTYRVYDINREIDLIEEISRIYGFNMFTDTLPKHSQKGRRGMEKYHINHIRSICRSIGLHEVIHSSLGKEYNTKIFNPLTLEYSCLRDNLLTNLIHSYNYNIKQSKKAIEIFEIGKIFQDSKIQSIESTHIAGLLGGDKYTRTQWYQQPSSMSWFQAKGDIEEIFERLNLNIRWGPRNENNKTISNIYNQLQNNYSTLYSDTGQVIGFFGQIKLEGNNSQMSEPIYGFEIILDNLIKFHSDTSLRQFQTYTKYPSIIRDIKIEVPEKWPMDKVFQLLKGLNEPAIKSIELFDVYNMQRKEKRFKSLGFRITYNKPDNTLTTEEVDIIEQKFRSISVKSKTLKTLKS